MGAKPDYPGLITALLALAAAGCTPRPQAPALENGPVYENAK